MAAGCGLLCSAVPAAAATDFGVRTIQAPLVPAAPAQRSGAALLHAGSTSLSAALAVVRSFGRVTSTYRSPQRNRAVGGVRNSYHLFGRAIDIVPRRGVRHADIEAALRGAGFSLIESLDEGDHSHFAFGNAAAAPRPPRAGKTTPQGTAEVTQWRVVLAPRGR